MGQQKKGKQEGHKRARRIFFLLVALLIWFNLLSTIGIVYSFIYGQSLDTFVSVIFLVIFACLVIGLLAVLYAKPPFHLLIYVGALINLIISLILIINGDVFSYVQGIMSFLILYFGFRYPIEFVMDEATFVER